MFCCAGIVRIALSNMDREVRKDYQVVIQAKDMAGQMGGLSGTTVVNVTLTDVNDSPPRFAYSKTLAFYESFRSGDLFNSPEHLTQVTRKLIDDENVLGFE